MKILILTLVVLAAFADEKEFKITLGENTGAHAELSCKTGDVIHLDLEENPTTGYGWTILEWELGWRAAWDLSRSDFEAAQTDLVGAPG